MKTLVEVLSQVQFHQVMEAVITAGVLGGMKFLWNIRDDFKAVALDVRDLKINHLPHLEEKINIIGTDVKEVREAFVDHLLREASQSGRETK